MFKRNILTRFTALATVAILLAGIFPTTVSANIPNLNIAVEAGNAVVTGTTVRIPISWNNPHNANVTEVGVRISTNQNTIFNLGGSERSFEGNWLSSPFNLEIHHLDPHTTYFARAYVVARDTIFAQPQTIIAGNVFSFTTDGSGNVSATNVHTNSVTFSNGMIRARGSFPQHFTGVSQRGFVASSTHNNPTVHTANRIIRESESNLQTHTHNIAADWTPTSNASAYYVRAFIVQHGDHIYGQTQRVTIGATNAPTVFTRSAEMTGARQGRVTIEVTHQGQSQVWERGVVFSDTNQNPELNQSNVQRRTTQGTIGEAHITLENLQPNTRYFVRAYAINNQGTSYGQTIELFTIGANSVQTRAATNITATSFTANGTVTNAVEASQIRESGFVFSTTNSVPTLSDSRVSFTNNRIGDFYMNIPNLVRDTRYFVRAYTIIASTSGANAPTHTIFGEVVEVRTTPPEIEVTINFLAGTPQASVGTQRITVPENSRITTAQLQVPSGFAIVQSGWYIDITNQTSVSVLLQALVQPEAAFVPGTGNFTFSPNRAATRAEVAQILHNLSTGQSAGGSPIAFADVHANHPNRAAIDYVSSRLFMRGDAGANTFRPNDPITRAEVTVVLMNFYGLSGAANSNFPDVAPTAWYFLPVSLAFANNMVAGYEDGTFGPHRNITRAEVTTIFVRGENRSLQPLSNLAFTDVPTTHWAHRFIMNASIPQN